MLLERRNDSFPHVAHQTSFCLQGQHDRESLYVDLRTLMTGSSVSSSWNTFFMIHIILYIHIYIRTP